MPQIQQKIERGYKKHSTLKFYKDVFNNHLKPSAGKITLRDFTTKDAQDLFDEIDRTKSLSHKSLLRIQTGLSAVFTYAKQRNAVQLNPVQGTKVEGHRKEPDRYAYSLKEVLTMIKTLGGTRASTVVALAAFTGLREGEIRGLQWQDYNGAYLNVCRSVGRYICQPSQKHQAAAAWFQLCHRCKRFLTCIARAFRMVLERISSRESVGTPPDLANLVRREMTAIADKGSWHGWHGFRRGLATRLHEAGVPVEVIREILRHSDPKVTQDSYIVVKSDKTSKAVRKIDDGALLEAWRKKPKPKE